MIVYVLLTQARIAIKAIWSAAVLKKHGTMNTNLVVMGTQLGV